MGALLRMRTLMTTRPKVAWNRLYIIDTTFLYRGGQVDFVQTRLPGNKTLSLVMNVHAANESTRTWEHVGGGVNQGRVCTIETDEIRRRSGRTR